MATFYDLLGVDESADSSAITAAYRRQARRHHPDVSELDDAGERFRRLTTARDVLTDERRRRRYDRLGHRRFVERYLDPSDWPAVQSDGKSRASARAGASRRAQPGDRAYEAGRRSAGARRGDGVRSAGRTRSRERRRRTRDGRPPDGDGSDGRIVLATYRPVLRRLAVVFGLLAVLVVVFSIVGL